MLVYPHPAGTDLVSDPLTSSVPNLLAGLGPTFNVAVDTRLAYNAFDKGSKFFGMRQIDAESFSLLAGARGGEHIDLLLYIDGGNPSFTFTNNAKVLSGSRVAPVSCTSHQSMWW